MTAKIEQIGDIGDLVRAMTKTITGRYRTSCGSGHSTKFIVLCNRSIKES